MPEHSEDSRLRRTANCGGCGRFVGPRNHRERVGLFLEVDEGVTDARVAS